MHNKILHVSQFLSPGGLERMIWNLSEELIRQGHQSETFIYDQEGEKTLLPEFAEAGIKTHFHQKDKGFSWKTIKELRALIKSGKFNAIHSHDLGALIYAALANLFLPVTHVHTQHSFIHFKKSRLYKYYEKFFCKFPDFIVVVSPHQVEAYKELGITAVAVTNGINYPNANPYNESLEQRRKNLLKKAQFKQKGLIGPIPEIDSKWILIPGRIQRSKGQTKFFEIFKHLDSTESSKIHFLVIGAPTFESDRLELETLYNAHPEIKKSFSYLGFHSNPLSWMMASDGVALLSEFEGFPLVPLESIGIGIPTLLSDIDPHLFLKDEVTLTSLSDLTQAISWVKGISKSENQSAATWDKKQKFRHDFSIEKMANQYLNLYEKNK